MRFLEALKKLKNVNAPIYKQYCSIFINVWEYILQIMDLIKEIIWEGKWDIESTIHTSLKSYNFLHILNMLSK